MSAPVAHLGPGARRQSAFGGLVPSAAVAQTNGTLVAALAVELHADGAVLPLLVLSDAPGLLGWEVADGLAVSDESGGMYSVGLVAQSAGLGALQATAWIEPTPPPGTRSLNLSVTGLVRTSTTRRGGVERPLLDEALALTIDLMPERTAVEVPDEPLGASTPSGSSRAPARSRASFADLVPIGQARLDPEGAVCLWALERYKERAVLTMAALTEEEVSMDALAPGAGRVEVWDDTGIRYSAVPIHGSSRATWTETSIELSPAVPSEAGSLGVRVADLPARAEGRARPLAGPFTYGIALPSA